MARYRSIVRRLTEHGYNILSTRDTSRCEHIIISNSHPSPHHSIPVNRCSNIAGISSVLCDLWIGGGIGGEKGHEVQVGGGVVGYGNIKYYVFSGNREKRINLKENILQWLEQ